MGDLTRILAPTGFSEPSLRAVRRAAELGRESCRDHLEEGRTKEVGEDVRCQTQVREGLPSAQIASLASAEEVDLIVMASRGGAGIRKGAPR